MNDSKPKPEDEPMLVAVRNVAVAAEADNIRLRATLRDIAEERVFANGSGEATQSEILARTQEVAQQAITRPSGSSEPLRLMLRETWAAGRGDAIEHGALGWSMRAAHYIEQLLAGRPS